MVPDDKTPLGLEGLQPIIKEMTDAKIRRCKYENITFLIVNYTLTLKSLNFCIKSILSSFQCPYDRK